MKLKFWEKQPQFYEEEVPARKRETLASLSDKLIMKEMKQNPDYGLKVAERVKHISKDEGASLTGQLKEYKQLQDLLKGIAGGGEGSGSLLRDVIQAIPQVLAMVPQFMPQAPQFQQPQMQQPSPMPKLTSPQPTPAEPTQAEPSPPQPTSPQPQQAEQAIPEEPVTIGQLTEVLDLEPEDAIEVLKQDYPGWLKVLSIQTVDGIFAQIMPLRDTSPEITEVVDRLTSKEGKKWLGSVIKLAKSAGKVQ